MWMPFSRLPNVNAINLKKRRRQREERRARGMGPFSSKAKTEKIDPINVVVNGMEIGHSSMQGHRVSMEDAYIITSLESVKDHTLVAILDGHAGEGAAIIASNILCDLIETTEHWSDYITSSSGTLSKQDNDKTAAKKLLLVKKALVQAFVNLDQTLLVSDHMDGSGCTLCCALITPTHIIVANVGDSRCVIGTTNQSIDMSEDHKPDTPEEKARIEKAGGNVFVSRVMGELAMSRAIGDFQYKDPKLPPEEQMVSCVPDVAIHVRSDIDQVLILACDGVWDVMENAEAIEYVTEIVLKDERSKGKGTGTPVVKAKRMKISDSDPDEINDTDSEDEGDDRGTTCLDAASALIDLSLSLESTDNISTVIVRLRPAGPGTDETLADKSATKSYNVGRQGLEKAHARPDKHSNDVGNPGQGNKGKGGGKIRPSKTVQ